MISYGKQSIDQSDIDAVVEVLKGDWLTQGPAVEKFENDLKSYFGAKHCCAVSNGTAALHLTGLALGWHLGDVIITTSITFLATANCIVYAGATPDFVDIDPVSYTIDPNKVEEKIKSAKNEEERERYKAEYDSILRVAEKFKAESEEDIYKTLELPYIVPELREDLGEIEAAEENNLPNLISIEAINGAFHNHTTLSDGEATLEQMADEAQRLNWKYLGISDHSESLKIANGLLRPKQKLLKFSFCILILNVLFTLFIALFLIFFKSSSVYRYTKPLDERFGLTTKDLMSYDSKSNLSKKSLKRGFHLLTTILSIFTRILKVALLMNLLKPFFIIYRNILETRLPEC